MRVCFKNFVTLLTDEWLERAKFTKQYLSNILKLNNFRCEKITHEVNTLTSRILKMFQEALPGQDFEKTSTMNMLKKIEKRVFDLLDLVQDCRVKVRFS